MKKLIQLEVPEPCHENWNNMSSTEQGKFCLACQKEVIDFSSMSDKEILNHISNAGSKSCGRFLNDQLNRVLIPPVDIKRIWWKYWMNVAATLLLLSTKSNAQIKVEPPPITMNPELEKKALQEICTVTLGGYSVGQKIKNFKEYYIAGLVTDDTQQPVIGASVIVKGTKIGTITDENGHYLLKIKNYESIELAISSIGYETQLVKVDNANFKNSTINTNITLYMQFTKGLISEVVMVAKKSKPFLSFFKKDTAGLVKSIDKPVLTVFPNPATKVTPITIRMKGATEGSYKISLLNNNGELVMEKKEIFHVKNPITTITCGQQIATGIYTLVVSGNGKSQSSQIFIK